MNKKKKLKENLDPTEKNNWYVASVATVQSNIGNILDRLSKSGITYKFEADNLIITAVTYSRGKLQDLVKDELKESIIESIKFLKDEYKGNVGKSLSLGKEISEDFSCVSNYTVNKMALCRLTCIYKLPELKAVTDSGVEKGLRNIPVLKNRAK